MHQTKMVGSLSLSLARRSELLDSQVPILTEFVNHIQFHCFTLVIPLFVVSISHFVRASLTFYLIISLQVIVSNLLRG